MSKNKNSHILVTGGAGFIGSHLVDALVSSGNRVRVLDNLSRGKLLFLEKHIANESVEFIKADLQDYQAVQQATVGIDIVFHLAAQANVMGAEVDPEYSFHSNVEGTFHVLQAALESGTIDRVIFSSSREVYGEVLSLPVSEDAPLIAKNRYGASKIAAEAYCQLYYSPEMRVSVLRLANVYGPRDQDRVIPIFIERIKQKLPLKLFGGEQIIDFIPIDFVVDAFIKAAQMMPDKPINIASGKGTAVRELAQHIIQLSGSQVMINTLPSREMEVLQFVANTDRMQKILKLIPPKDPLVSLDDMIVI
ncbi:MAG: SDR family NAD(P)-dependent oxidoreductase [Chloroflexi bacterium]|nr:SDR family NAD(P)-dependent oxidoreductase [Chloroflexota bacterium]